MDNGKGLSTDEMDSRIQALCECADKCLKYFQEDNIKHAVYALKTVINIAQNTKKPLEEVLDKERYLQRLAKKQQERAHAVEVLQLPPDWETAVALLREKSEADV